jgi:hypothetical protein
MEPFLKYIKQLDADKRLLDIYRQLRHLFKKYKWSEKDLENPPFYTNDMMELHSYFNIEKNNLLKELKLYFGNIDLDEVTGYIENEMLKINKETPLDKKEE